MLILLVTLAGCADWSSFKQPEQPLAFHDTRLQYAIVSGDDETLAKDFSMKLPPSMTERIVAGAVLPFTVATEAAFLPFFTSFKALAPSQDMGSLVK